jgi:hypothetical protein
MDWMSATILSVLCAIVILLLLRQITQWCARGTTSNGARRVG